MPIKIPNQLPAEGVLREEGFQLITEKVAVRQDIRPLRVAILNLMPDKVTTEIQLARLLSSTPIQIELTLIKLSSYNPKNTDSRHLDSFYKEWNDVRDEGLKFDGLIITGAPVETMEFEDVAYWPELAEILEWTKTNVFSSFFICWGANAALYHYYGVGKDVLDDKVFGVFEHKLTRSTARIVLGMDERPLVPVSRFARIDPAAVRGHDELEVLMESDRSGICLLQDNPKHRYFIVNHLEYDAETLGNEYRRDIEKGEEIDVPHNYFPDDDPTKAPICTWRANGSILFRNWVNIIYQDVPYDFGDKS